ncbi:Uncharacterised protein g3756 [Pycnogonum litorale]
MSFLKSSMNLCKLQGLEHCPFPALVPTKLFKNALKYEPDDSDVFVASYPKCGTTWTRMIVWLLTNDLKSPDTLSKLTNYNFLEFEAGKDEMEKRAMPRHIKTHLPFELVPYNPKTKYIYVARNPFDCCVSFYKHCHGFLLYDFDRPFDEFFELFMRGEVEFGDYFIHVISWYAHRNDGNVLFLIYEEMQKDPAKAIRQIGQFLGDQAAVLANDTDTVDNIAELSSFQAMKTLEKKDVAFESKRRKGADGFIRKGTTADFKNFFSPSQYERLMERYDGALKATTLIDIWNNNVKN